MFVTMAAGLLTSLSLSGCAAFLPAWTPPATSPAALFPMWSLTAPWPVSPMPMPLPTATSSAPISRNITWGGVRGIRGYVPLMDGGYVTRPEFSVYGLDSHWVVENYGVEPDVEVDNTPDLVMQSHDPQLEK